MNYKLVKMKLSQTPHYLDYGAKNYPCVVFARVDKPFAWVCDGELCDFEYMEKNNIAYKRLKGANGTTVVSSVGDWVLGFFGNDEFCNKMLERVVMWFSNTINGGKIINNDFMYNGNKYGAATSICLGDIYYLGVQISNKIDTELIDKICKKKSIKKPECLPTPLTETDIIYMFSDYGEFYEWDI